MDTYDKIKALNIDLGSLGLNLYGDNVIYYCTPKDANIIGSSGVDGIHFCTIPQFGDMIFAISPMNFGDCVHPIAKNFNDLLRLLLTCVSMDVLEQCYAWDEEEFNAYLSDCSATKEQQSALETIQNSFDIKPMTNAFRYIKEIQSTFDYSLIQYTEDYYDVDMNPAAPKSPKNWTVCFEHGYSDECCDGNDIGKEFSTDRCFSWNSSYANIHKKEIWHIPAVYVCNKCLVIEFCIEINPDLEKNFIQKIDDMALDENALTEELKNQIKNENPLDVEFHPTVFVNNIQLMTQSCFGTSWIPAGCAPNATHNDHNAQYIIEHYGLDKTKVWIFQRWSFSWQDKKHDSTNSINIKLEREPIHIDGIHFVTPSAENEMTFTHPISRKEYTLKILEHEQQELDMSFYEGFEFPKYNTALSFLIKPELPNQHFQIRDCLSDDRPLRSFKESHTEQSTIALIGGADGPTSIFFAGKRTNTNTHIAMSALHFEPHKNVEWKIIFYEKIMDDIEISLLS